MKRSWGVFLVVMVFFFTSCKEIKARRPISQKTTNIYKEAMRQTKKLNALENNLITKWIAQDTTNIYINSSNGFWYYYNHKVEEETPFPKLGDVVTLSYNIQDLQGNIIYSKQDLGEKKYIVDKEDFIPALEDGIKLMKTGETITFVIPSYRGFGVAGDQNKIGINQTIKSTVTLISIK